MPRNPVPVEDHRTRVGAERRARMRQRLVESAMLVFAEKGVDASVIDDVLAAAQIARGTFYYYFRTNHELLIAASEELLNEMLGLIEAAVGDYEDPAKRVAVGLRLYLHTARKYPLFSKFVTRSGFQVNSPNSRFYDYLPPHIQASMDAGKFKKLRMDVALDLISGMSMIALFRMSSSEVLEDYPEQVVATILRGFGMKESEASQLVSMKLVPLIPPPDSLLERSQARFLSTAIRAA